MAKQKNRPVKKTPFSGESRRGTFLALGVVIVGMLVSVAMFFVVVHREESLLRSEFNTRVQERVMAIQRDALSSLTIVSSLSAFYQASEVVSPKEFYVFTRPLLEENGSLHALGVNSVISATDLDAFELLKRSEGFADYTVKEKSLSGNLVPVRSRSEYVPVGLIAPIEGNEKAMGYDISSEPIRREAIVRAIKTLSASATGPINLVQEEGQQKGFLLIVPVPKKDVGDGDFAVDELAIGVFRVGALIDHAMASLSDVGIDFDVTEKGLSGELVSIHQYRSEKNEGRDSTIYKDGFLVNSSIELGGRQWSFTAWPTPVFVDNFITKTPANVLICGALFTFVVFVYLLMLNDLNERFHSSEEKFRLLSENIHGVFWIMGPHAQEIHYISPSFKQLFGFEPEEAYENPRVFMKAIHPEDRKRVVDAFNALSYGIDFHEEWRVVLPTGEIRWMLSHGFPVIRGVGDVEHIVGLASDITAQRRAEIERDKLRVQIVEHDDMEDPGEL